MKDQLFPKPGRGYLIREHLGGGAMKEAYRATSPVGFRDVAVLRYIKKSDEVEMENDFKILRRLRGTPYSEYLGYPEMFFEGADGSLYFAEELLARPLNTLVPMKNGARLFQIARDLFRGLQCLHAQGLKHSDIKLDNCGLDGQGRAKIFDLSSVASEPGDNIRGAVLTRAPEFFGGILRYDLDGDVWALGATIFALRTGEYPFVSSDETDERVRFGKAARASDEGIRNEAEKQKAAIDAKIFARASAPNAETMLRDRILETLPGKSGDLLVRVLSFTRELRPSAKECAIEWAALCEEPLARVSEAEGSNEQFSRLHRYLEKIKNGYVSVTNQQWDRLVENFEKLKGSSGDDCQVQIAQAEKLILEVRDKHR